MRRRNIIVVCERAAQISIFTWHFSGNVHVTGTTFWAHHYWWWMGRISGCCWRCWWCCCGGGGTVVAGPINVHSFWCAALELLQKIIDLHFYGIWRIFHHPITHPTYIYNLLNQPLYIIYYSHFVKTNSLNSCIQFDKDARCYLRNAQHYFWNTLFWNTCTLTS